MSEPPPTAVVVRGGVARQVAQVLDQIEYSVSLGYGVCLSVHADEQRKEEPFDATLYRICAEGDIPHGKVQICPAAGYLYAAGLKVVLDTSEGQPANHYNVVFAEPVTSEQILAFIRSFGEPVPNPTGGKKRR